METRDIGIRELNSSVARVLRSVREECAEYVITVHGEPVAVIRPYTAADSERLRRKAIEEHVADVEALADEIGSRWTSERSGVELVEEQRRG